MENERMIYLWERFNARSATADEVTEFQQYLSSPDGGDYLMILLENQYQEQKHELAEINPLISQRIFSAITAQVQEKAEQPRAIRLWPRILTAAAAVAAIVVGVYFFNYRTEGGMIPATHANARINPGKVGATLMLADGKRINLSAVRNGQLIHDSGISISKTDQGELIYQIVPDQGKPFHTNTLSTANGEVYTVVLPDKSKVYLNAASSLTYPTSFSGQPQRKVRLSGEGYFEVSKNKDFPFVVETNDQKITVLGTHFNVSSYPDEKSTRTTLLEGAVHIGDRQQPGKQGVIIKPGQQAQTVNGRFAVADVIAEDAIAWKEGYFRFNNDTMEEALKKIARWYDVRIIYKDEELKKENVYGSLSRFSSIKEVLKMLELTDAVKFKTEGKEITASNK